MPGTISTQDLPRVVELTNAVQTLTGQIEGTEEHLANLTERLNQLRSDRIAAQSELNTLMGEG